MKGFLIKTYLAVFIMVLTACLWDSVHASDFYSWTSCNQCTSAVWFNLTSGIYTCPQQLVMSADYGSPIYYTLDGTEPVCSSIKYSSPITISSSTTIKARTYRDGFWGTTREITVVIDSSDFQEIVVSPNGGTFSQPQYATIYSQNGDLIRYTTDGSEPNDYSSIYSSPIYVDRTMMIKAKTYRNGFWTQTFTASYIINNNWNPDWRNNCDLSEARSLFNQGLYDQAITQLITILDNCNDNEDALLLLIECYINKGDIYSAREELTQSIYVYEYPRVINKYAELCNSRGEYDEARQKLLDILPKYPGENYLYKTLADSLKGLYITGTRVFVYGREIDFSEYDNVRPVISEGRTLIPVRALSEALGVRVDWDYYLRKAVIYLDEDVIEIWDRQRVAKVNGRSVRLDVPAFIYRERLLVPIRFVSEEFDRTVDWFAIDQTVNIISVYNKLN